MSHIILTVIGCAIKVACGGMTMSREELDRIDEYTQKNTLNIEERGHLTLLLLKWMYEQRMLD